MRIENEITDDVILTELGIRLRRQRLDRNLTQAQLAQESGVSKRTLERLEAGQSTQLTNLLRVLRALGILSNLDALVPEPLPSPMERLKAKGKLRQRARPRSSVEEATGGWTWGDDR